MLLVTKFLDLAVVLIVDVVTVFILLSVEAVVPVIIEIVLVGDLALVSTEVAVGDVFLFLVDVAWVVVAFDVCDCNTLCSCP